MIVDLDAARKAKAEKKLKPSVVEKISVDITNESDAVISDLIQRWYLYSLQKSLNKLFCNDLKIPLSNYTENLSDIVEVERTLKIRLAVMPSDFNTKSQESNHDGRAALFYNGALLISTPLLPDEEQARMFAILLHQKILNSNQT